MVRPMYYNPSLDIIHFSGPHLHADQTDQGRVFGALSWLYVNSPADLDVIQTLQQIGNGFMGY